MSILQNCNEIVSAAVTESEAERAARIYRLKAAEIKRMLKAIDNARIRPLAAIVAGSADDYDKDKLNQMEIQAAELRGQLAELKGSVQ